MKEQQLVTYFDCESDAGAAQKATCLSVAAVTVDENFKIVDQWKINSRFRASRAFEVDAMLAHNIPVCLLYTSPSPRDA